MYAASGEATNRQASPTSPGWARRPRGTVAPDDARRAASAAKALASEAATGAARRCLQCHGAMGYTDEYDLHLWMKRA